jgi:hypothetical protein
MGELVMPIIENKKEENPLSKELVLNIYKASWDKDIKKLSKSIPKKIALQIKKWRVGDGPDDVYTHSWRGVATLFVQESPELSNELNIIIGNQISGMQLCDAAMLKLKESAQDGWN